jgi:DNA-binding MarR family transcriptional regulator
MAEPANLEAAGHILPLYDTAAAQLLRFLRRTRARRSEFFSGDLFSDPAWDILLYLYEAEITQQRRSLRDVSFQTGVPQTTVLRWLETLEGQGFICRTPDPSDGRRVFISLTDEALARMDGLFVVIDDELEAAQLRRTPK